MKIAIPVDETKTELCVSFGRTPYFLFADTETGTTEVLENPAAEVQGGAGLRAAQFVHDQKADAVITIRCGENAAEVFKSADISIYKAEGTNAQENIDALKAEKLSPLTHFHVGFQGIR